MRPKFRSNMIVAVLGLVLTISVGCTKSTPPPVQAEQSATTAPSAQERPKEGPYAQSVPALPENLKPATPAPTPSIAPVVAASSFGNPANFPVFTVDVSEYPSWIAFTYAQALGLLEPDRDKVGSIERKWGVDVVLGSIDYDPCITKLAGSQIDATTITNIDALAVSEGRTLVAVFPTSTSDKADTLLAVKSIADLAALKSETVWGLEKTVSHFAFDRILIKAGLDPANFTYRQKDPGVCATEMQQKNPKVRACAFWNPFKVQTMTELGSEVHELGNSGVIPLEILDLMVVAQDALDRTGGDRFAAALADTFYQIGVRMNDPATRSDTLLGMIDKFAPLSLEQMETCVTETKFFGTAQEGLALYENPQLPEVMRTVQAWTDSKGATSSKLKVGYGTKADAPDATFRYDPTYMRLAQSGPRG